MHLLFLSYAGLETVSCLEFSDAPNRARKAHGFKNTVQTKRQHGILIPPGVGGWI